MKTLNLPAGKLKSTSPRRTFVSLTDSQYEEVLDSVLQPTQSAVAIKSPNIGDVGEATDALTDSAAEPKGSASQEGQNNEPNRESERETQQVVKVVPAKNQESSSLSTLNSDDITKRAVVSTPLPKMKTYREAVKSLRQKLNDSLSTESNSFNDSLTDEIRVNLNDGGPFSQPSEKLTKRERLQWYQERRGTGLYVRCDHEHCNKWRWIEESDPVNLPEKWYCYMNPDDSLAWCSAPERPIPMYVDDDLIQNIYTAGSIVWAKVSGHPWWPAMVDDCPDVEQYYWLEKNSDVPSHYHVVFFDDREVLRRWMRVPELKSFKHTPNLDAIFSYKQSLKKRLIIAKQKANDALTLSIEDRLKKYSFITLWQKEIPEDIGIDEISSADEEDPEYDKIIKQKLLKCRRVKKFSNSSQNSQTSTEKILEKKEPLFRKKTIEKPKLKNISGNSKKAVKVMTRRVSGELEWIQSPNTNRIVTRRMSRESVESVEFVELPTKKSKNSKLPKKSPNIPKPPKKSSPEIVTSKIVTRRVSRESADSVEFVELVPTRKLKSPKVVEDITAKNDNLPKKSPKISIKPLETIPENGDFSEKKLAISCPLSAIEKKMSPVRETFKFSEKSSASKNFENIFNVKKPENKLGLKRKSTLTPMFIEELHKRDEEIAKQQRIFKEKVPKFDKVRTAFKPPSMMKPSSSSTLSNIFH